MKSKKKILSTACISILMILLVGYSTLSTGLLYLAIYDVEDWNNFKNTFFEEKKEKNVKKTIGDVVNGTVTLTIPSELVELMGEDYDYKLTSEQKENGFTNVKKGSDGSAIFTIKKEKYDIFIDELKKTTQSSINETIKLMSEQGNTSIKRIKYQKNFNGISVYVNKESYGNGFDDLYIRTVGLTACMYQMFDINSNGKCVIDVIDESTQKTFETMTFPDYIG